VSITVPEDTRGLDLDAIRALHSSCPLPNRQGVVLP